MVYNQNTLSLKVEQPLKCTAQVCLGNVFIVLLLLTIASSMVMCLIQSLEMLQASVERWLGECAPAHALQAVLLSSKTSLQGRFQVIWSQKVQRQDMP